MLTEMLLTLTTTEVDENMNGMEPLGEQDTQAKYDRLELMSSNLQLYHLSSLNTLLA